MPVGIFFTRHVYSFATITGTSMQVGRHHRRTSARSPPLHMALPLTSQPTFNPDIAGSPLHHDVVLLERWSIGLHTYTRGDVVTLWQVLF